MEYKEDLCFSYHYRVTSSIPKKLSTRTGLDQESVQGVLPLQSEPTDQGWMKEGIIRSYQRDTGCSKVG